MAAPDLLTLNQSLRRWWPCLVAGLALGLAALTRSIILTFVPLLLPWMIWRLRRAAPLGPSAKASKRDRPQHRGWPDSCLHGGLRFLVLAAACALPILPWTRELPLIIDMIANGGARHTFVGQADCPPAS